MSTGTSPSRSLTPRQREWLAHLHTWQRQGGSLKGYAVANELSVSGLYSARRVLAQRGAWQGRANDAVDTPAPKLVPVRVTSLAPTTASSTYRVLLPNGVVVEVPEQADPARSRALLACVMESLR